MAVNDETMKLGLIAEAAQAQQRLGEECLQRLAEHTRDLDAIVRDEVRRTVAEELEALAAESRSAADSLVRLRRAASLRLLVFTFLVTALAALAGLALASWVLPSRQEIASLRTRRARLEANIARLERHGGRIELGRCGARRRLCVRVDRAAPAYGAGSDFLIVKGG
jgi:hypothetical protein